MSEFPEMIRSVKLRTIAVGSREYSAVQVVVGDLHLSADLVNDRQIRLAHRLAASHGIEVDVAPELQPRVFRAMAADRG